MSPYMRIGKLPRFICPPPTTQWFGPIYIYIYIVHLKRESYQRPALSLSNKCQLKFFSFLRISISQFCPFKGNYKSNSSICFFPFDR